MMQKCENWNGRGESQKVLISVKKKKAGEKILYTTYKQNDTTTKKKILDKHSTKKSNTRKVRED
jgi:hypothetical protein